MCIRSGDRGASLVERDGRRLRQSDGVCRTLASPPDRGVLGYYPGMRGEGDLALVRAFKQRAEAALPGRVARVVLFGSRARGSAGPQSDWDVAVFLRGGASSADVCRLADAAYDLIVDSGEFIQPVAFPESGARESTILARIRAEGIAL